MRFQFRIVNIGSSPMWIQFELTKTLVAGERTGPAMPEVRITIFIDVITKEKKKQLNFVRFRHRLYRQIRIPSKRATEIRPNGYKQEICIIQNVTYTRK